MSKSSRTTPSTRVSGKESPHIAPLRTVLGATYALAIKTHGAHWNLVGAEFFALHETLGTQYLALFAAADEIAERLRALGFSAPGDIAALAAHSPLAGLPSDHRSATLVRVLCADHGTLAKLCEAARAAAAAAGDEASVDLLIGRISDHDKTAWMLKATLG